jgi:hypothetical protein
LSLAIPKPLHLATFSKEQVDNLSPLGEKTVQFQGKLFSLQFLQAAVAGPILGIDFLRRFKVTVAPETSQIFLACTAPQSLFA